MSHPHAFPKPSFLGGYTRDPRVVLQQFRRDRIDAAMDHGWYCLEHLCYAGDFRGLELPAERRVA